MGLGKLSTTMKRPCVVDLVGSINKSEREHMVSDGTSHIFRHLYNSPQCRTRCSDECFSIVDHASKTFQLGIKEAIHIQWEQPTLSQQLHHVNLKLSL